MDAEAVEEEAAQAAGAGTEPGAGDAGRRAGPESRGWEWEWPGRWTGTGRAAAGVPRGVPRVPVAGIGPSIVDDCLRWGRRQPMGAIGLVHAPSPGAGPSRNASRASSSATPLPFSGGPAASIAAPSPAPAPPPWCGSANASCPHAPWARGSNGIARGTDW